MIWQLNPYTCMSAFPKTLPTVPHTINFVGLSATWSRLINSDYNRPRPISIKDYESCTLQSYSSNNNRPCLVWNAQVVQTTVNRLLSMTHHYFVQASLFSGMPRPKRPPPLVTNIVKYLKMMCIHGGNIAKCQRIQCPLTFRQQDRFRYYKDECMSTDLMFEGHVAQLV